MLVPSSLRLPAPVNQGVRLYSMEAYEFIDGHERIVAHFGFWPSFHDAEVFKLVLERSNVKPKTQIDPVLDLHLRGWVLTSEIAPAGHYTQQGDALFHFRFEGVRDLQIEGFNGQNVLTALNLELATSPDKPGKNVLKVELEHCFEFEASFTAERARLISITPYANQVSV